MGSPRLMHARPLRESQWGQERAPSPGNADVSHFVVVSSGALDVTLPFHPGPARSGRLHERPVPRLHRGHQRRGGHQEAGLWAARGRRHAGPCVR